jgi:long-chain acyl-CoA synthetase
VWETIKKGAEAKLAKSGMIACFLFKVAMRTKKAAIRQHRFTPLFDLMIFKKFKRMIGGSMKFTLSGGGAISADVQEWVRAAFGCPLVQGYGLTETCGGATIQHPMDLAVGIAGSTLSSIEITLHSEAEITDANGRPYLATDKVHTDGTACEGRGEVWLRGTSITSGYYKMPEKTTEDFDAQGWFHTGDIGLMTPAGQLRIVDRKKNLVKLKGGEYVALELMNVTYNNADIINADSGGVCSFADDSLDRPVAFAQCKLKELTALAREAGVVDKEGEELCRDPRVMKAVKAKLDVVAKAANLPSLMCVVAVMPLLEPWTAANGCLTATSKLVSKEVYKAHAEDLKMLKALGTRG